MNRYIKSKFEHELLTDIDEKNQSITPQEQKGIGCINETTTELEGEDRGASQESGEVERPKVCQDLCERIDKHQ